MIVGQYRDNLPRVLLTLHGESGPCGIEFVVDTGFDGYLTPPGDALRRLGSVPAGRVRNRLADGSIQQMIVCLVTLEWEGELREVEALLAENNPLLGTLAFANCHLDIEAVEGGEVLIEAMA